MGMSFLKCQWIWVAVALAMGASFAYAQSGNADESKMLTLPGRVQQQRHYPDANEPTVIDPVPQWTKQKPVRHSAISQGAVVPVVLISSVALERLRVGDLVEFETTENLLSSDGSWKIPKESIVHAKVASWNWAQTGIKRVKIGFLFYEFVTPEGWVVPFEGSLLGLPKPKKNAPPLAVSMSQGQIPAGGPGVVMFSKNPLVRHHAKKNRLRAGEVFPLRISQAIYYGASLAYQDKVRNDQYKNRPDKGVVPVNYPHFSDNAMQDIEQYQDDALMPLP